MKQLNEFIAFVKKNRVIIYTLIGVALLLQICSTGTNSPVLRDKDTVENNISILKENSISEKPTIPIPEQPKNDFNTLLIMAFLVLAFFVAKRFGLLEKAFPKMVVFRVVHLKNKTNGNLVLKVFLLNKTNKSISFNHPTIEFFKGSKKREFVIKNIGGLNYFPLTLTPGTGHRFTIDTQKFYSTVDNMHNYKLVRMSIPTISGKKYTSIKWPSWLIFRKI